MGVRGKLTLSFGVISLIFIAVIILTQIVARDANLTYEKLKLEAIPAMTLLDKFESISRESFLLTSTKVYNRNFSIEDGNRLHGILEVEFPYLTEELLALKDREVPDPRIESNARVGGIVTSILRSSHRINELLVSKGDYLEDAKTKFARSLLEESLLPEYSDLYSILTQLKVYYQNQLESYRTELSERLEFLSGIMLYAGILAVFLGLTIAIRIGKSISDPIVALKDAANRVSKGDYEASVTPSRSGELEDLGVTFNAMVTSLKENFALIEMNTLEIKEKEEQFRAVIEGSPAGVLLLDYDGAITLLNREVEEIFGYDRQELLGLSVEELLPHRYGYEHSRLRNSLYSKESSKTIGVRRDLFGVRKDGREFHAQLGLNVMSINNEEYVLASVLDISERKSHEAKVKEFVVQLEHKNKELEQFTYIASHDLQEPLRTITSFIGLLKSENEGKLSESSDIYLNFVSDAAERMSSLIRGLLDYARIGSKAEYGTIDCNELVANVLGDLNHSIEVSNAKIEMEPLPTIHGYRLELRLLFQNLISNALKFSKINETPHVKISSEEADDGWIFHIADRGIGIALEHQARIFSIFQKLHSREEYQGVGIGLSHCRKIVELHGGQIWVDSQLDAGSTFSFMIPNELPDQNPQ